MVAKNPGSRIEFASFAKEFLSFAPDAPSTFSHQLLPPKHHLQHRHRHRHSKNTKMLHWRVARLASNNNTCSSKTRCKCVSHLETYETANMKCKSTQKAYRKTSDHSASSYALMIRNAPTSRLQRFQLEAHVLCTIKVSAFVK